MFTKDLGSSSWLTEQHLNHQRAVSIGTFPQLTLHNLIPTTWDSKTRNLASFEQAQLLLSTSASKNTRFIFSHSRSLFVSEVHIFPPWQKAKAKQSPKSVIVWGTCHSVPSTQNYLIAQEGKILLQAPNEVMLPLQLLQPRHPLPNSRCAE